MSSEKAMSLVLTLSSVSTRKAWRTMVVRATSPKVPIWGRPDGPYPVSKITSDFGERFRRSISFLASSNGQAFETSAASRSDCNGLILLGRPPGEGRAKGRTVGMRGVESIGKGGTTRPWREAEDSWGADLPSTRTRPGVVRVP